MCENQPIKDVVGTKDDGFPPKLGKRVVNQRVHGILPFLHMNISEDQFKLLLKNANGSVTKTIESFCNAKQLEKKLKDLDGGFNCRKQSKTGTDAFLQSVMESIVNRWRLRDNGRAVLNKIEKVQRSQCADGLIPNVSIKWCEPK